MWLMLNEKKKMELYTCLAFFNSLRDKKFSDLLEVDACHYLIALFYDN